MHTFIEAKTRSAAKRIALRDGIPCEVLVKVFGGYAAFATITDYEIFKNQK